MKLVREHINEKFKEESDPIHDMNIGPQGIVYRCGECGSFCDSHNNQLSSSSEEFEISKKIIEICGDKSDRIKYVWCEECKEEEYRRQEEEDYEREQQREWERQQEEEERWKSENEDGDRYY